MTRSHYSIADGMLLVDYLVFHPRRKTAVSTVPSDRNVTCAHPCSSSPQPLPNSSLKTTQTQLTKDTSKLATQLTSRSPILCTACRFQEAPLEPLVVIAGASDVFAKSGFFAGEYIRTSHDEPLTLLSHHGHHGLVPWFCHEFEY